MLKVAGSHLAFFVDKARDGLGDGERSEMRYRCDDDGEPFR